MTLVLLEVDITGTPANGDIPTYSTASGKWAPAAAGGGGEVNTASNAGAGGVGLYDSKVGVDLRFKNINAGSSKVTITNDAANKEVDIDVVPANFTGIPESGVTNLVTDLAGKAATSTTISTVAPLSGGGDLSANRTITTSMATNKLIGRGTAGTGVMEEITLGTNLSLAGTTLNATGGGSGNSVTTTLAFGASFTDKAQTVVTGQAWVTTNSEIIAQVLTPSGTDPDEMRLLDFKPVISDLVAATGFTVTLYSEPEAKGDYSVMCVGV
jgi:hypothetical protein